MKRKRLAKKKNVFLHQNSRSFEYCNIVYIHCRLCRNYDTQQVIGNMVKIFFFFLDKLVL